MGGGKETPRQKLIGLMYLVLMALLAMNVSKSILSAFITINGKFEHSAELISGNTDAMLAILEQQAAAAKGKEKLTIKAIQDKASEIRQLSKETSNFFVENASKMILKSDPVVPSPFYEVDDLGNYKLLNMDTISSKDDYDTPTNMFLQTEDKMQPNAAGDSVQQALFDYRNKLVTLAAEFTEGKKSFSFDPTTVARPHTSHDVHDFEASLEKALESASPKDRAKLKRIMQLLTPPEIVHNHHDEYSWISYQFDHAVIVAAATIFTSLKNDVKMAESIAIEMITGRASVEAFKFNKIDPLAFSSTSYINQGDTLGLQVMIAAYDSTEKMELRYRLDDPEKKGEWLSFKSDKAGAALNLGKDIGGGVGEHFVEGEIAVKVKGEKVWKPWKYKYSVGAPNGAVANAEMNVLYRGWKNKIEVSASGYDPSTVNVKASSGVTIKKSKEGYIATVSGSSKEATLSITALDKDGKSVKIVDKKFRIFSLPKPNAYFANQTFDKPLLSRGVAKRATKLMAKIGDSPLDVSYTVSSFDMIIMKKGQPVLVSSKSNKLTGEMKNAIGKMSAKSMLTFTNVKAVGPTGKASKIPGLTFKMK